MKRAFVTGASGFTGSYLCAALLKKGYAVTALMRKTSHVEDLSAKGITLVEGDLAEPGSLQGLVKDTDILFHIGALYRQEGVAKEMFTKVNVHGTRALLDEAVRAGVKRFVHCSTVGVQGEIAHPPAKETDPYNPGDHYQESKMEGEKLALSYFADKKLDVTVVRPVGIYGPGDTRFLKLFRHIYRGNFRMIGPGKALYHLTYVEDLVDGIILAAESAVAGGRIYTLAGPQYLPLEELVHLIADILGKKVSKIHIPLAPVYVAACLCELICRPLRLEPPIYRRRLDFFTKDRAFDITRARQELGYAPQVSLRDGLNRTARWYLAQGLLD